MIRITEKVKEDISVRKAKARLVMAFRESVDLLDPDRIQTLVSLQGALTSDPESSWFELDAVIMRHDEYQRLKTIERETKELLKKIDIGKALINLGDEK